MGGVLVIGWVTLVYATAGDRCSLYSSGNTEKPGGSLLNISGWTFERLICYRLETGDRRTINTQARDTHGSKYRITNTSGNDYFVPTKTEREWNAFKAHLPRGVSLCERDIALLATENDGIPGCTKVWECNGSTFSDVTATTTRERLHDCTGAANNSDFYTHSSRTGFNWWNNRYTCHDGVPDDSRCIPISYSWEYDDWTVCSASCGGTRTRTAACRRSTDNALAPEAACTDPGRVIQSESCNLRSCLDPPTSCTSEINCEGEKYCDIGGACAGVAALYSCQGGHANYNCGSHHSASACGNDSENGCSWDNRGRSVSCNGSETEAICTDSSRCTWTPSAFGTCKDNPVTYDWGYGRWSACSVVYGTGTQTMTAGVHDHKSYTVHLSLYPQFLSTSIQLQ